MEQTEEVFEACIAGNRLALPIMITDKGARIAFFDIRLYPQLVAPAARLLCEGIREKQYDPKWIVTVDTKGPVIAGEVAKLLGIPMYVIYKTPQPDFCGEPITGKGKPITSDKIISYYFNFADAMQVAGYPCIYVDDVISGGKTKEAVVTILSKIHADLLDCAAIFREGYDYRCWFHLITLGWLPVT